MSDLEHRYGGGLAARQTAMFAEAGLPRADQIEKVPNSRGALMLGELARDQGAFLELHPRLFAAYWAEGRDISDREVLVELGAGVGLAGDTVTEVLDDERYLERVQAQTNAAVQAGVGGVPAWVVDRRRLIPGAQPHEVFERALEQMGYTPVNE
jgi:predicted DsbA family dithiol-disulfide isomerase